ncbi:hypothetical protein [Sphingomonas sanguinis]|uniref:Uncharacterized protein n=1 Tax=Sphingomonas sanguinis TaxID=33051 RepID=A0A147HYZ2_9SPHN|nr:hypothetical protein [Sphingomonas sanguinis]KTT70172.1 hypothetical protein NS319_08505 [Sphingomonas sanguinis]
MATAACLPIAADRAGACVRTIFFVGLDLTGVPLALEARLNPETPGPAPIALGMGATANAEGLRLIDVTVNAGVPTSQIVLRVNESTMKDAAKLPYSGELGSSSPLYYDLIGIFGQDKRRLVYGTFTPLPTVYGMSGAPADRPMGYGSSPFDAGGAWNSARVTFGDDTVAVTIDGADLVGAIARDAQVFSQVAADMAGQSGAARNEAQLAAAIAAGFVDGVLYPSPAAGLAAVADGKYFTVRGGNDATYALLYQRQGSVAVMRSTVAASAPVVADAATFAAAEAGPRGEAVVLESGASVPRDAVPQKRYRGGPIWLGDVPRDHNHSIAGAVIALEEMCSLGDLTNTLGAIDAGFFRMGELGDSITKGSQVNLDDGLGAMDGRALASVLPASIRFEVASFAIPGKSGHDFIRSDYKAASAVTDPSTQFSFPEQRIRMRQFFDWKGGTQPGLTWPQHVFLPANKPHLLVNRLGENSWPETLTNFASDLRASVALVQAEGGVDQALQTPILPTRADPAYAAQEKPLRAIASVIRSVAKQYGLTLFDAQRLQDVWRDGVDTVDMLTVKGQDIVPSDWVTPPGFTPPTFASNLPTFSAPGMIVRTDLMAKNGRQSVTVVAASATAAAGVAWRVDSGNYRRRYIFDVAGGPTPKARFYFQDPALPGGQQAISSYDIAPGTDGYYTLEPEFEDGKVILVVNGVQLDVQYVDHSHDWGLMGLIGEGGGRVVSYQTWTGWPRPATFQQLSDRDLFGDGSFGTFGVDCYVSGDAEHHPHANGLKLIIHAAQQRFFALLAAAARMPTAPPPIDPILVTDNDTVLSASDYVDVTVNGSAASGSQIVGNDGDVAITGSKLINVTVPSTPVAVKVRRSGTDYMTASVTVATKGWWRFDVFAEYSSGPTRAQMLVIPTRVKKVEA